MTEAQAWRAIAARIEDTCGRWTGTGLCWEVTASSLSDDMTKRMHKRIKAHMVRNQDKLFDDWGDGPWAFEPGDADVRILAAYFLALEAEDEAR